MLHYQPQLDVSGQRAIGVEALIRWQKPTGELIPPSDFIALAEELGLISEIGDWALHRLSDTGALAPARPARADHGGQSERLGLIRTQGVRVAIDDFGTGYSSLAYLKRLPLDYLKLDRAFVQDLETDSNDAAICAATIGLAHNLGLAVVAEGVETQAQRHYLANLGCDAFQGYYFSAALCEAEA